MHGQSVALKSKLNYILQEVAMKRLLKILAIYGFFLPTIFNIIGLFINPGKVKYVAQYPYSFVLELLLSGGLIIIPYLVTLGLAYINIFKKKPEDKYYLPHKIATIVTTVFVVAGTTLINVSNFLNEYYGIHGKVSSAIAVYGSLPEVSVVLVLIVYGIGLFIGWLIQLRTKTTQVVP
jgi:hypothetical protein